MNYDTGMQEEVDSIMGKISAELGSEEKPSMHWLKPRIVKVFGESQEIINDILVNST